MAPEGVLKLRVWFSQTATLALDLFAPPELAGTPLVLRNGESALTTATLITGRQTITATLPIGDPTARDSLEITLETTAPPVPDTSLVIGTTEVTAPMPTRVESSGVEGHAFADIYLGDTRYSWNDAGKGYGRGYNLLALDPQTRAVSDWQVFDTVEDVTASDQMAAFVEILRPGTIVAVAVKDDGSAQLSQTGVEALRLLGCTLDVRGAFRAAHACVGVKGATPGSAEEAGLAATNVVFVGPDSRKNTVGLERVRLQGASQ